MTCNPFTWVEGMSSVKVTLLLVGAVFEFSGILILAFPDLWPYRIGLNRWLRTSATSVWIRLRRLFGRRTVITVRAESAGSAEVAGRVSVLLSISPTATLEQKVEHLLNRSKETQQHITSLQQRLEDFEAESKKHLDQARREVEDRLAADLRKGLEAYRRLRICGAGTLLLGLTATTFANFIN